LKTLLANFAFVGTLVFEPHINARPVRLGQFSSTRTTQVDEWFLRVLLLTDSVINNRKELVSDLVLN
jgi:hypothetical protein